MLLTFFLQSCFLTVQIFYLLKDLFKVCLALSRGKRA